MHQFGNFKLNFRLSGWTPVMSKMFSPGCVKSACFQRGEGLFNLCSWKNHSFLFHDVSEIVESLYMRAKRGPSVLILTNGLRQYLPRKKSSFLSVFWLTSFCSVVYHFQRISQSGVYGDSQRWWANSLANRQMTILQSETPGWSWRTSATRPHWRSTISNFCLPWNRKMDRHRLLDLSWFLQGNGWMTWVASIFSPIINWRLAPVRKSGYMWRNEQ